MAEVPYVYKRTNLFLVKPFLVGYQNLKITSVIQGKTSRKQLSGVDNRKKFSKTQYFGT